jgi:hypothetical protein
MFFLSHQCQVDPRDKGTYICEIEDYGDSGLGTSGTYYDTGLTGTGTATGTIYDDADIIEAGRGYYYRTTSPYYRNNYYRNYYGANRRGYGSGFGGRTYGRVIRKEVRFYPRNPGECVY